MLEAQTDAPARSSVPTIPPGDYMLSARYPGFSTVRQRVRITGAIDDGHLALQVGTLTETVTVSRAARYASTDQRRCTAHAQLAPAAVWIDRSDRRHI